MVSEKSRSQISPPRAQTRGKSRARWGGTAKSSVMLALCQDTNGWLTPRQVIDLLARGNKTPSQPAIYRTLEVLQQEGFLSVRPSPLRYRLTERGRIMAEVVLLGSTDHPRALSIRKITTTLYAELLAVRA